MPHLFWSEKQTTLKLLHLFSLVSTVFLFAGCVSVSTTESSDFPVDTKTQTCVHPQSGMTFPKYVASLERINVTADAPIKGSVRVSYTTADQTRLTHGTLHYYLNAYVEAIPKSLISSAKLLERSIQEQQVPNGSNFTRSEYIYVGGNNLSHEEIRCTQCSFDRAGWNDRVTSTIVIVPRGNYIMRFEFLGSTAHEKEWQPAIDAFIREILACPVKTVS